MTGYEAIQQSVAWLDLTTRGRLLVSGEDAARLLHAITTNDIKSLLEGEGSYVFFLTAQGRILADAYVSRRKASLFLDTEPEIAEKLREHIDKYIIADDAEIAAIEGWTEFSLEGPNAVSYARELNLPVADKSLGSCDWLEGLTARIGSCTADGVRVLGPASQVASLRERLNVPELTAEEARVVRLENGIPRYGEDITERFLVQETGRLQAVHFNKGCYLGQEIVERVRSRAQVHRHLRSLRIGSQVAPVAGTKLTHDGRDAGEITSAVYSPRLKEVVAMAYIRTDALMKGLRLGVAGGEDEARVIGPE